MLPKEPILCRANQGGHTGLKIIFLILSLTQRGSGS